MEKVFVYGTLRQGEKYHSLLRHCRCLSIYARMAGRMSDTEEGYPGVSFAPGIVIGELYEVTEADLEQLDILEDYLGPSDPRNLYERVEVRIETDADIHQAWTYLYRKPFQGDTDLYDWKLYRLLKQEKIPYFAYGSCMDLKRIEQDGVLDEFRHVLGRGSLHGFNLQFTLHRADGGRADIVETGGITEGKVYIVDRDVLTGYLYGREGVMAGVYRPLAVTLTLEDGSEMDCATFAVVEKSSECPPPAWYALEILRGARPIVSAGYYRWLLERLSPFLPVG